MTDSWFSRQDLHEYAEQEGYRKKDASMLWRLIEDELRLPEGDYPGLQLQPSANYRFEVSLTSLVVARDKAWPHMVHNYGPLMHQLFCGWVGWLQEE